MMERAAETTAGEARTQPRGFTSGILGPPRPSVPAQVSVALFGLLTIASIAFSEQLVSRGQPLIFLGMTALGTAELLDPSLRRFTNTLRIAGPVIGLSGLILVIL